MRRRMFPVVAGASLTIVTPFAGAQNTQGAEEGADSRYALEEIVVTARRRDERLIDVPVSVNAVTSQEIERLSLRQFEDVKNVVPGLSLSYSTDGTGASAAMRGVKMDVAASGFNGTVEFYLNDTPIIAEALFPLMYDLGQIEVLRGPQGTLRGRASPSGSITVTTRRPDLDEFGGYVSATGTDTSGMNGNGAINVPIVAGKLALRLAGAYDDNEFNQIERTFGGADPNRNVESGRASLRFEPTDSLSFDATYQKLVQKLRFYDQFESASIIDSSLPASPLFIDADDRQGLADTPTDQRVEYDNVNLRAQWAFAGQLLNYAGAYNKRHAEQASSLDPTNFFGANAPAFVQNQEGLLDGQGTTRAHELRLSSEERVFGMFDYILGAFYQETESTTNLSRLTPVFFGPLSPTVGGLINVTPIRSGGEAEEKSAFFNLTYHLGAKTEISGGLRHIDYQNNSGLLINGVRLAAADNIYDDDTWIYTGSVKYNFNDDMMMYVSTGSSWRPGISVTGDFNLARSALENSFLILAPEESTSYELGFKANGLDDRLRSSLAFFHQKFDNYPYRSASSIYFRETAAGVPQPRVNTFNFVAPVPVEVNGVEAQVSLAATQQWDIGVSASYSKGEIDNALIPCNDYVPRDGIPDTGSSVPTADQILAATGDNLATCLASYRASNAPLFGGTVQSEFRLPLSSNLDTYVRGLVTYNGTSQNDPANAIDDVSDYTLLNLYLGLRSHDGAWEVTLYGKNITDTDRVLRRDPTPATLSYQVGRTSVTGVSTYRRISMTDPREFGVQLRYAFGSR
jgi:iron complex outermembrane recepter protein